ncbi:ImmA/IrrE family metallo-endopeptidase [Hyalangium versicolor]|uniref:ImmA/IrrE family metallo-endopeptidase n=1 Tax=Hyalangium versicolor TaxID=2861190 RepID=UPI001CCD066F|nr:ImmA/IrrE family metallo-endopeptidase [Hyalangium versicolor]
MSEGWLQEAVRDCGLPDPTVFPRDLMEDIPLALTLTVVPVPDLTPRKGLEWLVAHKRAHGGLAGTSDPKHGFTVAHAGGGVLFLNSTEPPDEQRFTLAHEVAHFVLDHLQPRMRALRARGKGILPVLNGEREPNIAEQFVSVFERLPYRTQANFMDRNDEGKPLRGQVMESEQRADRLAFELLAPRRELLPLLERAGRKELEATLVSRFGLPVKEAQAYARWLLSERPSRRPFLTCVPDDEERD